MIFSFFFFFLFSVNLLFFSYFSFDSSFLLEFSFFNFFYNELVFSFLLDYVSLLFFSVVCLISFAVFLYSKFYFSYVLGDLNYMFFRYSFLLSLFVFSMFFLVFSNSFLLVMVGWDGLGLVSFLLVIYYNNSSSLDSGVTTILTNRIGDCLFILSFLMMFGGGWFFLDFFPSSYFWGFSILLGMGCLTKSAQIPFSSWLPMAMAAPTPVSSLVHSSTLVTAGVYLIIRFNFLLSDFYWLISPLSLFTMLVGGFAALCESDLKKVVAMSTLSQLGFMIFSVTLGSWVLGFLHMLFHAFFKSSLFLGSGNLMHYLFGSQDSRLFGSLGSSFFSKLVFCVSGISLMGFPFSLGYYSKDCILGLSLFNNSSLFLFVFLFSCCLTVSYSLRLINLCFSGFPSFPPSVSFKDDFFFCFPVIFLIFVCIVSGNFFLFNFLPPVLFSFFDFFFGVLIMLWGLGFYLLFSFNYYFFSFSMSIMFLVNITLCFSSLFPLFPWKEDKTWGELVGGSGVVALVSYFQFLFKPVFYLFSFSHFLLIIFAWVLLIS